MPLKSIAKVSNQETLHLYKDEKGYSLKVNDEYKENTTSSDPYFSFIKQYVIKKFGEQFNDCPSYLVLVTKLSSQNIFLQIKDGRRNNLIFLLEY